MGKVYKHYKNNLEYQIIDTCRIQVNNQWEDAYIYVSFPNIPSVHNPKCVRTVREFNQKFTLVKDSRSIIDSCSFLENLRNFQFSTILGKYKLW